MKSSSLSSSSDKPDPNKNPNLVVYGPSNIHAASAAKVNIASVKAIYLEVNNSGGTVTPETNAILQPLLAQASGMSMIAHGARNITAEGEAELTIGDTDTTAIRYNNRHNSSSTALTNKELQLTSVASTSISNKETGYIHQASDQENIINKAIRLIEQIYPKADEDDVDIKKFRGEQLALLRSFSTKEPNELEVSRILELITGLAASLPPNERYTHLSISTIEETAASRSSQAASLLSPDYVEVDVPAYGGMPHNYYHDGQLNKTLSQENHHRELKLLPKTSEEALPTVSATSTSQTLFSPLPLAGMDKGLIKKAKNIFDREYPEADANNDEAIKVYREEQLSFLNGFKRRLTDADKEKINDLIKELGGEKNLLATPN